VKNIFAHIIITIIGLAFLLFGFAIALINYDETGKIDYLNMSYLCAIGLFLLFAKDDLINNLLSAIIKGFVR